MTLRRGGIRSEPTAWEPVWLSGHIDDISDEPSDSRKILDPPGRLVTQLEDGAFIHIIPEGPKVGFNVTGSEGGLIASQDFRKAYYWREDEAKQVLQHMRTMERTDKWHWELERERELLDSLRGMDDASQSAEMDMDVNGHLTRAG